MNYICNPDVKSLYTLSLNQLCITMDETTLRSLLEQLQPSLCLEILWKTLCVDDFKSKSDIQKILSGYTIAEINFNMFLCQLTIDSIEHHGALQQTKFIDNVNFSSLFNQELFFKLVEVTNLRDQLFTLFQICVQIKGFNFPLNFAQEWIKSEIPDTNEKIYFLGVERGLKLGVFLGDSGWLNESALVLSHTYKIITTKWVCHDQNLQLLKTLQCLTKWLIVLSNYHNFKDAKIVLRHMLHTIDIIKQIEERTLCIAYACVAVSEYYFVLQQFDEAWSWGAKAILELHKNSGHLKIIVLSHGIKVCTLLNKLNIAHMLNSQVIAYNEEISDHTFYHLLFNGAYFFYTLHQKQETPHSLRKYHALLDYSRNLFGYYNLRTAMIMVDYTVVCRVYRKHFLLKSVINNSMRSILQAINIMHKIGLPDDNMLLVNAYQIKTLVLHDIAMDLEKQLSYHIYPNDLAYRIGIQNIKRESRKMLRKAEVFHLNSLKINLQSVIRNTLVTAHLHTYLGRFYIYQKNYSRSKEMLFRALEIKKLLLGENHVSFAQTLSLLACLHLTLKQFQEAEVLYLQVIKIYENSPDGPHLELELIILALIRVYHKLNNTEKCIHYFNYYMVLKKTYDEWLLELQSETINNNCKKEDLSLEKFKCILNKCNCTKS